MTAIQQPLYTIDVREDDNGNERPNEILWAPSGKDATDHGFRDYDGLHLAGIGAEDEEPTEFVTLGHGHTWTAIAAAADQWMRWYHPTIELQLHTRPPSETHAVFLRHPHPANPCGCEWDGMWRLIEVPAGEPGAMAVTVMQAPRWVS